MEEAQRMIQTEDPDFSDGENGLQESQSTPDEYESAQSQTSTHSDMKDDITEGNEGLAGNKQVRKKRERRSKDDNSKRNYVCGCGKMYLSYAALYTHAKVKHSGVFPEGTTTLHKKKQGRPKVVVSKVRKKRTLTQNS
jgi:hypothetical protein